MAGSLSVVHSVAGSEPTPVLDEAPAGDVDVPDLDDDSTPDADLNTQRDMTCTVRVCSGGHCYVYHLKC
ncbi:MAG: hypothetical protein ABI867_42480 [Kofleriaceae bacterium]